MHRLMDPVYNFPTSVHSGRQPNNLSRLKWRLFSPTCVLQVEIKFDKNEFYEVLRNRTLEDLFEENGRALGMKFTNEGFSGETITHFSFWTYL